jgi:hypothetical protein
MSLASGALMQRLSRRLPHAFRQSPEVVVGRTAAACLHPLAAWRIWPRSWRLLALTVYAAAGYLTVLTVLVALSS